MNAGFHYKQFNLPGLVINDKTFKDILLLGCIKEANGKLYLPQDIDDVLRVHVSGSALVEKKNQKGQLQTFWKDGRNIHLLDYLKYLEGFKYWLEPRLAMMKPKPKDSEQPKRQYTWQPPPEPTYVDSWS